MKLMRLVLVASLLRYSSGLTVNEIRDYCGTLPNSTLIIGMITKGNTELTLQRWRLTFETYLTHSMSAYGCATKLIPLQFDTYEAHTANRTIDFIFPNPTAFQEMKSKYGVHEFLSVKRNFGADQELDRFGGVIVRKASHLTDVIELADLQSHPGLRVCAVNPNAFGGYSPLSLPLPAPLSRIRRFFHLCLPASHTTAPYYQVAHTMVRDAEEWRGRDRNSRFGIHGRPREGHSCGRGRPNMRHRNRAHRDD